MFIMDLISIEKHTEYKILLVLDNLMLINNINTLNYSVSINN